MSDFHIEMLNELNISSDCIILYIKVYNYSTIFTIFYFLLKICNKAVIYRVGLQILKTVEIVL